MVNCCNSRGCGNNIVTDSFCWLTLSEECHMSQKQTRLQKRLVKRREETKVDTKLPAKVRPEIKKKLDSSKEVLKKIDELLKEASAKLKEVEQLKQALRYCPRVPNCEGRMIDLRK